MRVPWTRDFPDVVVHQARDAVTGHWCYNLAKRHCDERRALSLCEALHCEDAFERLYEGTFGVLPEPMVVAPAHPLGDTQNALARTFARYVAKELGFQVTNDIHQTNAVKRDFIRSPYFRMSQAPTFGGTVVEGATYLLVDDVFTMGGTLAALRGFITRSGGIVVGMTTFGEKEGRDVPISLARDTFEALSAKDHGAVEPLVLERTGHPLDCLTEAEGRFLLKQPSADAIGTGFDRAGNR